MRTSSGSALAALAALATGSMSGAASGAPLPEIRETKRLRVAVYTEFAPFADDGQGVDVEVGKALAEKLGAAAEISSFKAAENMNDDLRNVVWKGHYLRKEPLADVMMHVPVDPVWARKNEQVRILAPYYRERLVVARNRNVIPNLFTLDVFGEEKIGVQFDTLEDNYLFNSFGGRLRQSLVHYPTTLAAAEALKKNEIAAVMGLQSHLEASLGSAAEKFGIAPVATPGLPTTGWDVGVAVKADNPELAAALEKAMAELLEDGTIGRIFTRRGITHAPPHATHPATPPVTPPNATQNP